MSAIYNGTSYDTLAQALTARGQPGNPASNITIEGTTPVSLGGTLTIDQSVVIVAGTNARLVGVTTVTANNVSFSGITFSGPAGSELVTALGNSISITGSIFDGATTASRAFVASGQDLTFTGNTISGFVNGSYLNPGATGTIISNTISNSGNGFVADSTGFNLASNTFVNIARSNISITATDASTNLAAYFDGGNAFDGSGTQIAVTRTNAATTINGSAEADLLVNAAGATSAFTFNGLGGNDTINSGQGDDIINGDAGGSDTVIFTGSRAQYTITANVDGSYTVADQTANRNGTDTLTRIEAAQFSDQTVALATTDNAPPAPGGGGGGTPAPTPNPNPGAGTAGNDTISAGASTQPVFGGGGSDTITATPAAGTNAVLYGGSAFNDPNDGADSISVSGTGGGQVFGNGGDDTIVFTATGSASIFGGVGNDSVSITNDAANQVTGGPGLDSITISGNGSNVVIGGTQINDPNDGSDTIRISGNGNNTVYSNGGDDTIVITGTGNNTVFAGVGNDSMQGGSGNDTFNGGPGNNVYTGGAGADRFIYTATSRDIITDFNFASGDRLDVGGRPYNVTSASDGSAALVFADGGVIILQGVTQSSFQSAFIV